MNRIPHRLTEQDAAQQSSPEPTKNQNDSVAFRDDGGGLSSLLLELSD